MAAHLLYQDFLRFLDALAAGPADPWKVYERIYLEPHRAPLEAWWEQCIGQPREVWQARVRSLRLQDYGLLQEVVREGDLTGIAREAMARCQSVAPLSPEPAIYYLVGFFSPDGFTFQVEGRWAIGVGLERLGSLRLLPILLAHEYGHCYRRTLGQAKTVGERLVDEGFAVALSARSFPERPEHDHLLMRIGQVAALREYEDQLWGAVGLLLPSQDEGLAGRIIYGRGERRQWPSRAGMYLGWRMVQEFLRRRAGGFSASAEQVLASWPGRAAGEATSLAPRPGDNCGQSQAP
jgi:hypothetical protein